MAIEIERKFLARMPEPRELAAVGNVHGDIIRQGYIGNRRVSPTRVRIRNQLAFITIKGPVASDGMSRLEFEYEIPLDDARQMLESMCTGGIIEKTRYRIPFGGMLWELDEFSGENKGLIIAEVELSHPSQSLILPDWVIEEVTGNLRYSNSSLSVSPFSSW